MKTLRGIGRGSILMAQRYCTNCGAELREDDRYCPNCGRPVHETAAVSTPEADVPVPPPPQQEAGTQPLEQAEGQPRGLGLQDGSP
jgi:predicted amidophosphoribosyltransferase